MRITANTYYEAYLEQIGKDIADLVIAYDFSDGQGDFKYLTKVSAVYSSNIEGNTVDLNSFMNYEQHKQKFKPTKEVAEIKDLIAAYELAQKNKLSASNVYTCHEILAKTLLIKSKRGVLRTEPVGVFGKSGLIYLAVEPKFLEKEMTLFFEDLKNLLSRKSSIPEVFYQASLIHLKFVHIHPFMDGNGRIARLIEKWFVAEKLGTKFWRIPSEAYYKSHQEAYYDAINIGVNYYELDYRKCLGFLKLLPNCLDIR